MEKNKMTAKIVSSDSKTLVIKVDIASDSQIPKVGDKIIVTKPSTRRVLASTRTTQRLGGKDIQVSDAISRGKIVNINGDTITVVCSNSHSRKALLHNPMRVSDDSETVSIRTIGNSTEW